MSESFNLINHTKSWKKGNFQMPAMVSLALGSHGSDGESTHYLTEQLACDKEIDEAFDRLSKNLESDRNAAKKILKKENEKIRSATLCDIKKALFKQGIA